MTEPCKSQLGVLRGIRAAELELMLEWRNAPSVRANMYTRHVISRQEHMTWWERTQQRSDQYYFMYERAGRPLGIVAFTDRDTVSKNASWAFYASPEAPKGTGSRMEFLALEHAFNELDLHKLYCEVLSFNEPVVKLHQKFGFSIEGVFREQHRVDERMVDVYRLGLLSREWLALRDAARQKVASLDRKEP